MLESLAPHLPGDWEFRENDNKFQFFVNHKDFFLPLIQKKVDVLFEKGLPPLFPFEEQKGCMSDEELKEYQKWSSVKGYLEDHMTTKDIANY